MRYHGPSKMSLFKLLIHSFSIIAVFKYQVFFRSIIILLILALTDFLNSSVSVSLQILIVIFNVIIFVVSLRENQKELFNSDEDLKDTLTL